MASGKFSKLPVFPQKKNNGDIVNRKHTKNAIVVTLQLQSVEMITFFYDLRKIIKIMGKKLPGFSKFLWGALW